MRRHTSCALVTGVQTCALPICEEGRRWLLIHIANLFGVDKVPFDDRIEWTLRHHRELVDSAENPLDGARFWATADSPYCALAACFEFAEMLEQGVDYVSRIPVALDGSCSGQIGRAHVGTHVTNA